MSKGLKKEIYVKAFVISAMAFIIPSVFLYFSVTETSMKMVGKNLKGISERISNNINTVIDNEIEEIEDLTNNSILISFINEKNERYSVGNQEDIKREISEIDEKWINGNLPREFFDNIIKNPISILLRSNTNYNISYLKIFVTDKMGVLVSSTNKTSDYYYGNETWWQETYNNGNGKNYIDKIGFNKSANVFSLDICLPIKDRTNDNVIGIAKVILDIKKLIYPLFYINLEKTGKGWLISTDGTSIIDQTGLMRKINNDELINKIMEGKSFFIDYGPFLKKKMIFAATPINQKKFFTGDKLYILISQNFSEAISPAKRLIKNISIIGIITLIIIFYFGKKFLSRLIDVINTIQKGIDKIGYGKEPVPVLSEDKDELDNLTIAFNNMAKAIKERDELKVDKSELEIISKELKDKNVELGEFIYSISHDLRAPVVSISGYSSILVEEYADKLDEDGKKYLKRISENTAFMEQLIHDLIDLSRAEKINYVYQDLNISEILEVVSSQFSEEIRKKKIDFVVKSKLNKIYADKTKVIQVFNNLIGNAIKYINTNNAPRIEVGGEMEGDFYKFYIKDNGIGMSKSDQEKIFKLFYRIEGTGISGTGVGLSIVKKIVERHQGKIWIESELGKGSTFHFTLYKSLCDINEKSSII